MESTWLFTYCTGRPVTKSHAPAPSRPKKNWGLGKLGEWRPTNELNKAHVGGGGGGGWLAITLADWAPATGPPAGRQRRGSAEGCRPSASRGANPPCYPPLGAAGRDSHQAKTQKPRPALSVNTQPDHVLPLAHFGATFDVCDSGLVRTDHHNAREVRAPNNTT
jgi:hypothetical protein